MTKTLAIIGTAGRGSDTPRINRALYDAMYDRVLAAIGEWGIEEAVSGGAAVADHLAVRAYLDGAVDGLTLFLPAPFEGSSFRTGAGIGTDPGATTNRYHAAFSQACSLDSLAEIELAIRRGARTATYQGFHRRNLEVAQACDFMLAFTFGNGTHSSSCESVDFGPADESFCDARAAGLRDGGTAHTWNEAWRPARKRHVHLGVLASRMPSAFALK